MLARQFFRDIRVAIDYANIYFLGLVLITWKCKGRGNVIPLFYPFF